MRGFKAEDITLPAANTPFPLEQLKAAKFDVLAKFAGFPEGPSYHPASDSLYFAGNVGLRRLALDPSVTSPLMTVLEKPSGGGTHFLPDGSLLHVGHQGLRRIMPDGRIFLLADIKGGNDITVGAYREIYFSVPKEGIFRLSAGNNGKLTKVSQAGCNGLDVDPSGKFLYVHRAGIRRYAISGPDSPLGPEKLVHQFPKGTGGADGCTFDSRGNLYSIRFKMGTLAIIDPRKKKLIAEINLPVKPASNITFGGKNNTTLLVTAGVPKKDNCAILKCDLGITGFPGHPGSSDYPSLRLLAESSRPLEAR